jgi:hypothetical protein
LAQFKKQKKCWKWVELSCRRQGIKINFNIQLGEAYHGLGDERKDFYFQSQPIIKIIKIKMNKF